MQAEIIQNLYWIHKCSIITTESTSLNLNALFSVFQKLVLFANYLIFCQQTFNSLIKEQKALVNILMAAKLPWFAGYLRVNLVTEN